jgi:hypothetical protein
LEDINFQFTSPIGANYDRKKDWLHCFPKLHKNALVFSKPKPGAPKAKQVMQDGTKSLALLLMVHLKET